MKTEPISVAGTSYDTVWLQARIRTSVNPEVYIVHLPLPDLTEPPMFFASPDAVRIPEGMNGGEVDGKVQAVLLAEQNDDKIVVLVSGDAVSYGPQLVVPRTLAE